MIIDIIICTYNRPIKVVELVNQLRKLKSQFNNLIVIDSSDVTNDQLDANDDVIYLISNHKNQPYQRYLGYLQSSADYLLYLDDDMEIATIDVFESLKRLINQTPNLSGIAVNFKDKHLNTTLNDIPKSALFNKSSILKKAINWLSAYQTLPDGQFGLCGVRGKQPVNGGRTQWLSGGAFLARKSAMFQNFNFQLFDLFENKMGMGEDGIVGYGLSKQGELIYAPELLFYHNDQRDSSYSLNHFEFTKKVIFSRLYLSYEKQRIDHKNLIFPWIYYNWYTAFRVMGLWINYLKNNTQQRREILLGALAGWKASFSFQFRSDIGDKSKWVSNTYGLLTI